MSSFETRRADIRRLAARKAAELPRRDSGFWFHADLRDNFYLAVHLFVHSLDVRQEEGTGDEANAMDLAAGVISKVMALQDQNPQSPMYGHWPLNLGEDPAAAKPNALPVELMGCLVALFYSRYGRELPPQLKSDLSLALTHIYQSEVYRKPLQQMNHHEAKHTALKMLLGHLFDDRELLSEGIDCARRMLAHVRRYGFKEYGSLPWHWHWIQAFTCVWEVVDDTGARAVAEEMLVYLWELRADYYLKGIWAGPHSREWPHDAPRDNNTLMDYIQFGDFPEPVDIPRLEGAGLYAYQIPEYVKNKAVNRSGETELRRTILITDAEGKDIEEVHSYTFITPSYAAGGMYERREEFDNEQHRWDISLPLTTVTSGVNQAYFFHPGKKYKEGDDRHASDFGEVLLHQSTAVALYALPSEADNRIVGCLPPGEWVFESSAGFGLIGDVYIAYSTMQPAWTEQKPDRVSVRSEGAIHGVVMEALSREEARTLGIASLQQLRDRWMSRAPLFHTFAAADKPLTELTVNHTTLRGAELFLGLAVQHDSDKGCRLIRRERTIQGSPVTFEQYRI
ncbi:hypothetical protein [Paenibacillus hamazuiensis]|uniref:hypothetical protein n=1 Tax=Paenibacillus hamazuiensis TaxID=2936508 RepID=UPI00200F7E2B|nr:hypothetical protein [Paenibacillus hamazuiensis]